ncbi:MAG: YegS/Rv2252/BmrU family lipid kinase [Clostridia bacterium]|nr:YegS/Rv2252/BmrU family lipid kinase [Clostridia bacterium]NCC67825.1 YegS/Rv2252/BmrU family lipid kinase [Clostridia bacterium]
MRHLFIVNPVAGKLRLEDKLKRISSVISNLPSDILTGSSFEVYVTQAPMDACKKVKEAAQDETELRVYACGGDGTLNECVNGAAGLQNVAVTSWPIGTGNDFVRTFGKDEKKFHDLAALIMGEVRPLDLIDCNGRMSISICSVGVDARVGQDVHKYSSIPVIGGAAGYVISTAANYIKGLSSEMTVQTEGLSCGPEINLVCACNGRYYGGGFNPVPDAMPDDGIMDCLIVSGITRMSFIQAILGYAKGKYKRYPQYITHVRTTELVIDAKNEEIINLDGEIERAKHIVFRMVPKGINFLFPKDMVFFK